MTLEETMKFDQHYINDLNLDDLFKKLTHDLEQLGPNDIVRLDGASGDYYERYKEARGYIAARAIDRRYRIRFTHQRDIERAQAAIGSRLHYDPAEDAYRYMPEKWKD